ncbi:MAG: tetrahydromethanopterin S-methyltransferase subunit A [Nitrososphaeraceae archaeon]
MIYKKIENSIGELCKYLIPIKHEYYLGNGSRIAICTLSSIKLLIEISNDTKVMNNVAIVGRLLSENKGIDKIIKYCLTNKELVHLIVCGKDARGHRAGDALIALSNSGVTKEGKIIMSKSPSPHIMSTYEEVQSFRNRITIHNLIEETNLNSITSYLDRLG